VTADAAAFGAITVDLEPPFLGHALQLTNIATGDTHPNQAGYAVIAAELGAAVPDPSSVLMLALGVAGSWWAGRCRIAGRNEGSYGER
jgi:hypothetical protein